MGSTAVEIQENWIEAHCYPDMGLLEEKKKLKLRELAAYAGSMSITCEENQMAKLDTHNLEINKSEDNLR